MPLFCDHHAPRSATRQYSEHDLTCRPLERTFHGSRHRHDEFHDGALAREDGQDDVIVPRDTFGFEQPKLEFPLLAFMPRRHST